MWGLIAVFHWIPLCCPDKLVVRCQIMIQFLSTLYEWVEDRIEYDVENRWDRKYVIRQSERMHVSMFYQSITKGVLKGGGGEVGGMTYLGTHRYQNIRHRNNTRLHIETNQLWLHLQDGKGAWVWCEGWRFVLCVCLKCVDGHWYKSVFVRYVCLILREYVVFLY